MKQSSLQMNFWSLHASFDIFHTWKACEYFCLQRKDLMSTPHWGTISLLQPLLGLWGFCGCLRCPKMDKWHLRFSWLCVLLMKTNRLVHNKRKLENNWSIDDCKVLQSERQPTLSLELFMKRASRLNFLYVFMSHFFLVNSSVLTQLDQKQKQNTLIFLWLFYVGWKIWIVSKKEGVTRVAFIVFHSKLRD